jgi:PAS domain S-box-containing protein
MDIGRFPGQSVTERSEYLLNRMIEEVKDYAIVLLDREGNVIHWNKGGELIKGYTEQDVLGKHFRMFYPEEDRNSKLPEQQLERAANHGKAVYEGWRLRKDKTPFWGSIVLTALHDDNGNVIAFSKVTRDLTERKNAEDILRAKNSELENLNQELASFAYVASHDLQEPLRKIQTFLSRIEEMEKDKLSERSADFFKRIQSASARMQTLIEDLLSYSRTTTDKRQPERVDLNELLWSVTKEMTDSIAEKKATIQINSLPVISGIPFQLNQLFTNLFSNALKFSKNNVPPLIVVSAETIMAKEANAHGLIPGKNYEHVIVKDNGIGFESVYNKKVFEIFQRLHGRAEYSGTGIGLAICKKIVDNHEGVIYAEGEKDIGATFHIFLPALSTR